MYIRFSREIDKEIVLELLYVCFGKQLDINEAVENLDGRYLLAFNSSNKLIGMTGLHWYDSFNAYGIDWTCTHPEYRCQGVMHKLFNRICSITDEDIYSVCWRLGNRDRINLYSLMRDFGFIEVINRYATWDTRYNCKDSKDTCLGYLENGLENSGKCSYCRCYQDLWCRHAKKKEVKH